MDEDDPHIHVEAKLHGDTATRDVVASAFGLVGDLPGVVTTGCGRRAPRAMTSPVPERVTCLACRDHAHRQHLRHAEQVERLGLAPGTGIGHERARLAADRHRDLARRFAGTDT